VNPSEPQAGPGGRACLLVLVALALTLTPLACGGSGPEMARVTGTVTYKSRPVMKGLVTFVSTNASHRNATGQLDPNGGYRLQTESPGDGAELGDYQVTIYAHDEQILDYKPKVPVKVERRTPEKYENPKTSGLRVTVKSGSNEFNFPLTDD
jgi:hypothetical protein